MKKIGILEGILFVVGDDGINLEEICKLLDISETEAKSLLSELRKQYDSEERGITISYLGNKFKLITKIEHSDYYKKYFEISENDKLSNSMLETLAIIAYNGPITRNDIDELRGVSSSYIVRKLLAKDLIKISGKSDLPGKPNLYIVTDEFLDYFGLATLNDLPKMNLNDDGSEEQDLYSSIFKE